MLAFIFMLVCKKTCDLVYIFDNLNRNPSVMAQCYHHQQFLRSLTSLVVLCIPITLQRFNHLIIQFYFNAKN